MKTELLKRLTLLEASNKEIKASLQTVLRKLNTMENDSKPIVVKPVQYVILRTDLVKSWPTGAYVAQACHASTAALLKFYDDKNTQIYASDLENMTKITLGIKSEEKLKNLSKKLTDEGIDHHLWNEQPENYPTALATKPYLKKDVEVYFKKFNLLK